MASDSGTALRPEGGSRSLASRWLAASLLRADAFASARDDARALGQAAIVVLAGGLARGLGMFPEEGWPGLVGSPAVGVVLWVLAAGVIWVIAELRSWPCELPQIVRTTGFAAAPLVALALCAVLPPSAARLWGAAVHAWATLALVAAVREALAISPLQALWVCVAALGVALLLLLLSAGVLLDAALFT